MSERSRAAATPPRVGALRALISRGAGEELAKERHVPLLSPIAMLLDAPGLQRGTTVLLEGDFPGVTSLALALMAGATTAGMWCAVHGLPELGLAAAAELGVGLDRLVLVPGVQGREAMFLATLLEACDVVCAALTHPLSATDARRLVARVRERRAVLVVLPAPQPVRIASRRLWPEVSDLHLTVTGSRFVGLAEGESRIAAHLAEVTLHRRRAVPAERRGWLWLPGRDGGVALQGAAFAEDVPTRAIEGEAIRNEMVGSP